MAKDTVKLSPLLFRTENKMYRVHSKKWNQRKFELDTAYLLSEFNDYVYPYRGIIDNLEYAYQPGIYTIKVNKDKRIYIVRPKTDDDKYVYSKERIIMLTPDSIFKDLRDDIAESIDIDMNSIGTGDMFKPQIGDGDDLALAGTKYVLSKKNIEWNAYGKRFDSTATKNNGRRALYHGTTLKMDMLHRFCEIFDINVALLFWDKKNCLNPISDPDAPKVYVIYDTDEIDLSDNDIQFEVITR